MGELRTMGAINDATENADPGIEEVTRNIAPVRVGMSLIVSGVGGTFGSAKRRVERVAGLEFDPDISGRVRGYNGADEGDWSFEARLRRW